jgi:hypothetical protein
MPEEIKLSAGAPFAPAGTGTTGVGCDEPEPVIPVPDTEPEPADNDEVAVVPALDAAEFVVGGAVDAADDLWLEALLPLGAGAAATAGPA